MELFTKLFGSLMVFVYHCFDRIVIHGYLSGLSRPEQVVYFFHEVAGKPIISKDVLALRTDEYRKWIEGYATNHQIPTEWAEKGVRKEDYVRAYLQEMERKDRFGVYFIFKSMEQGASFRSTVPRYPVADPNYRILTPVRSRFTHYYFYLRDEQLGPMIMRVASFFPFQTTYYLNGHSFMERELLRQGIAFRKNDNAFLGVADPAVLQAAADRLSPEILCRRLNHWTLALGPKFSRRERQAMNLDRFYALSQVEYCRNFIFRRNFPIAKIFQRASELGVWRLTAQRISQFFGVRLSRRFRGKLYSTLEQVDHGQHVFRAYWKSTFLRQYEKFRTFLRQEICCNNLPDLGLKKSLVNLAQVRQLFLGVLDRFATWQAECFNAQVDFPLLQRLALPLQVGKIRYPGIRIHDTRVLRLMEILMHSATVPLGWTSRQIHQILLTHFQLSPNQYTLPQLRYDLRKMRGHGLLQRVDKRYTYRLTEKGLKVSLLYILFHKRIMGPLANSQFHHRPNPQHHFKNKLERAYHKADQAIDKVIEVLQAA
jgi:hypothetical protein